MTGRTATDPADGAFMVRDLVYPPVYRVSQHVSHLTHLDKAKSSVSCAFAGARGGI